MGKPKYLLDLLERAVWTYLEAFVGLLIAGGVFSAAGVVDIGAAEAAAVAAVPTALAVIKGGFAKLIGNNDSASTAPRV